MNYEVMSDEELMAAYYSCDDKAIEELRRRYGARLEYFFRNAGLSKEDAQDNAQDTLVQVVETKHGKGKPYDPGRGAPFKTWLFTIAKHLLIDELRQRGREVNFSDLEAEREGEKEEVEPFEETIPSTEHTPEEVLLKRDLQKAVHECMKTLPDRERIAIALWLETEGDMKQRDLADRLDVAVATANRVLKKAFRLMGERLEGKGYGGSQVLPENSQTSHRKNTRTRRRKPQ